MFFPCAVGGHSNLSLSWHVLTWSMYLGKIYVNILVILTDDPLSQEVFWLCLQLLTGRMVLRAFWESSSCIKIISSVAQSCPTLCDPMDCSTPGFPVHHQLPEFTQTHVHWFGDAIQPSHPLSSPSPPFNLSEHQGLFQWVSSLHQVAKVLEFQLQHQSFQWIFRVDFL